MSSQMPGLRVGLAIIVGVLTCAAARAAVIIDNDDGAPTAVTSGSWSTSSATGGYYGTNYYHDNNTQDGSKSITYTPTLTETRVYTVTARWTSDSNRATNAPYVINHAGGSTTVYVDQRTGGGTFNMLGNFTFNAGTSGNVVLSNTGTDGYVIADAVAFDPLFVVVDNPQASLVGSWITSSANSGYVGSNYIQDGNTGKGSKSATYTPNLPYAGMWEVLINYTSNTNRATNVPVDINYFGGSFTATVDETTGGGTWQSLGSYLFRAGKVGNTVIRTTDTDNYVIADAFQFRLISLVTIPEPTTAVLFTLFGAGLLRRRR